MPHIKLIGNVNMKPVVGIDGDVIEVTDANADVCSTLLEVGSAVKTAATSESAADDFEADDDDDDEDDETTDISRDSPVTELLQLGIHGRYVKALQDAGITTLGGVADAGDKLNDISGISPAAAQQIRQALGD